MNEVKKCKAELLSSGEDDNKLRPVTIRFPDTVWKALSDISADRSCSMAQLVRQLVEWSLSDIDVYTGYEDQMEEIKTAINQLTDEISSVQRELHRIGVNFNQEIRLRNIEQKYAKRKTLDERAAYFQELNEVKEGSTTLDKVELEALMHKYEDATKKAGEIICRILE